MKGSKYLGVFVILNYIAILLLGCVNNGGGSKKEKESGVDTINGRGYVRESLREYYKDGSLKDGIYKEYHANGHLRYMGWYCRGEICDEWYIFNAKGYLEFYVREIRKEGGEVYSGYCEKYYTLDNCCLLEQEGAINFENIEQIERGKYRKVGNWKYYDKRGQLIKEEIHQ